MKTEAVRTLPAEPLAYRDDPAAIFGNPWSGSEPPTSPAQPGLAFALANRAIVVAPESRTARRGLFFRRRQAVA